MKTREEMSEEIIRVPQDMLIDVLAILFEEGLPFEITQVRAARAIAIVAIQVDGNLSRHEKILQNLQDLLEGYDQYRFSDEKISNWRES
jgi:hypothetical protein